MPPPVTVLEFASLWLSGLSLSDLHKRTRENYAMLFRLHLRDRLGNVPLVELRRRDVRAALIDIHVKGGGKRTVQNCYTTISSLCATAVAHQEIEDNPASGALKGLFRRRPAGWATSRAMSRDQLADFFTALPETCPQVADYFLTLAGTGMRPAEALALEPDALDPALRRIHVRQQWIRRACDLPKGRKIRWVVDVPHEIMRRLQARAEDGRDWLFQSPRTGVPYDISHLEGCMREAVQAARLPRDRHFTPHSLRHTWATIALEETGNLKYVANQLGHSSVSITGDLYGGSAAPQHPELADRLDVLLRRRGPLRAAVVPTSPAGSPDEYPSAVRAAARRS